jgi:hypothetical protein
LPKGPGGEEAAVPAEGLPELPTDVPRKYNDPEKPQFERDINAGENDLKPFELQSDKAGSK